MAKRKPTTPPRAELPPGAPHVLDVPQACAALSISTTKLYGLVGDKQLAARKLGDRLVFLPEDIAKLIASLPAAAIKPPRKPRRRRLG